MPLDNKSGPQGILAVEQNKQLMSSRFYVSWGFADCSVRVCHVDTDRATVVSELTQNADWNGEVVACAVANEKVIVTGQTNSVISVWELSTSIQQPLNAVQGGAQQNSGLPHSFSSSHPQLRLKRSLHGHSNAITCIATSPAYNIILSGSKDRTCIVWDLARLAFTRQLPKHDQAIDSVAINECSGDLATADGSVLHIWDINGAPLATVDTDRGCSVQSTVLCIAFSHSNDWDVQNVVVTGGSDGVVRFWSSVFCQKRVGLEGKRERSEDNCSSSSEEDEEEEVEQEAGELVVSREVNPDKDTDSAEEQQKQPVPVKLRGRFKNAKYNRNSGSFLTPGGPTTQAGREARRESLRGSRSEGNLQGGGLGTAGADDSTGSFEVLSEIEIEGAFALALGFEWRRELVYRGKLTLHTSYSRKDNLEPASITAVGIAKDHKTIYIGDARGRVYGWSVSESSIGGRADHWVRDEVSDVCTGCSVKFTLTERRHHCRNCGQVFCAKCTHFESEIFRLKILKPVRVCQPCFTTLKEMSLRAAVAVTQNNSSSSSMISTSNNNNALLE